MERAEKGFQWERVAGICQNIDGYLFMVSTELFRMIRLCLTRPERPETFYS
jgi:hypothetical protein